MSDGGLIQQIEDLAEEVLIEASDSGFLNEFDTMFGFERADDGWMLAVLYTEEGSVSRRFRVNVSVEGEVTDRD